MKKLTPVLFTTGSVLIILASFDAGTVLLRLFLVGEIPGTRMTIPASVMLLLFVIAMLAMLSLTAYNFAQTIRASHRATKLQKLPKRRFAQTV